MKTTTELNATDIAKIIADKFNCPVASVSVFAEKEYEGQGPTEHEVITCYAKITISKELR